jgi:hypothetical protein
MSYTLLTRESLRYRALAAGQSVRKSAMTDATLHQIEGQGVSKGLLRRKKSVRMHSCAEYLFPPQLTLLKTKRTRDRLYAK